MGERRTFKVKCDETYTTRKTVWYEVDAESFDDARERICDGYGEVWDEDVWDEDREDQSIEEIECRECGAEDEDDCDCGREDYHVPTDANPEFGKAGTVTVHDLQPGMLVRAADRYTTEQVGSEPLDILRNNVEDGPDSDGDYRVRYMNEDYGPTGVYVNDACQFYVIDKETGEVDIDDEDVKEAFEEEQRQAALLQRKLEEEAIVAELINV